MGGVSFHAHQHASGSHGKRDRKALQLDDAARLSYRPLARPAARGRLSDSLAVSMLIASASAASKQGKRNGNAAAHDQHANAANSPAGPRGCKGPELPLVGIWHLFGD